MENTYHVVIGVGGTGGKIIREFRKNIMKYYRTAELSSESPVKLEYLYIDSSESDLKNTSDWQTILGSVALADRQKMQIPSGSLQDTFKTISTKPYVSPWLGNSVEEWPSTIRNGATAAAQKRKYGRFLFSMGYPKFESQINAAVTNLRGATPDKIKFHIFCGLAGGTGSGALIDVVCQIRRKFPASKILLYLQLPDRENLLGWAESNYYANGYAALKELNALILNKFSPYNIAERTKIGRNSLQKPFNSCYIYSNENERSTSASLDKDLPTIVADFLYQKIFFDNEGQLDNITRTEGQENLDEVCESDRNGVYSRYKAFSTFGIKKIQVPVDEINEYVAYQLSHQTLVQMLYKTPATGIGYVIPTLDKTRLADYDSDVRKPDNLGKYQITDDHLTYSKGSLGEQDMSAIDEDWIITGKIIHKKHTDGKTHKDKFVASLREDLEIHFKKNFRSLGVPQFFKLKKDNIEIVGDNMINHIDRELYNDFLNGSQSLNDSIYNLDAIYRLFEEKKQTFQSALKIEEDNRDGLHANLESKERGIRDVGILSDAFFNTKTKALEEYNTVLKNWYISRTKIEGINFSLELLPVLTEKLLRLKAKMLLVKDGIVTSYQKFQREYEERCNEKGSHKSRVLDRVIKFYDPKQIQKEVAEIKAEINILDPFYAKNRTELFKLSDNDDKKLSFTEFERSEKFKGIFNIIKDRCVSHIQKTYEKEDSPYATLFKANVVEKICSDYSIHNVATFELINFAKSVKDAASCYVQWNGTEISTAAIDEKSIIVIPKHPKAQIIAEAFKMAGIEIPIYTAENQSEIVIMMVKSRFPLRYIDSLAYLKNKYQDLMVEEGKSADFLLHIEGKANDYPDLYEKDDVDHEKEQEIRKQEKLKKVEILPSILLAKALDILSFQEDPKTGEYVMVLKQISKDGGRAKPYILGEGMKGQNLLDVYRLLVENDTEILISTVKQWLAKPEYVHKSKKEAVKELVILEDNAIYELLGQNDLDPLVQEFTDAREYAVTSILKLS